MSKKFEDFIDSIRKTKHSSEREFNATELIINLLRQIEFTKGKEEQAYYNLIASASTEYVVTFSASDSKMLRYLIKNSIRYFKLAIELMIIKAAQLAEEQGVTVEPVTRASRISYQKKLTRAIKRAVTSEGDYGSYTHEKSNDVGKLPRSIVSVRLNAFIFRGINQYTYKLLFTGISIGIVREQDEGDFVFDKIIEHLF